MLKQDREYLSGYTEKSGFNIVLTEFGGMTFPLEQGFSVPPGMETNIGFKLVCYNKVLLFVFVVIVVLISFCCCFYCYCYCCCLCWPCHIHYYCCRSYSELIPYFPELHNYTITNITLKLTMNNNLVKYDTTG